MNTFFSKLFGATKSTPQRATIDLDPAIPGKMVDIVMPLIVMQTLGSRFCFQTPQGVGNYKAAMNFSGDDYCVGYLTGLFDAVSQKWGMSHEEFMLATPAAYALFAREAVGGSSSEEETLGLAIVMTKKFVAQREPENYALGQSNGGEDMFAFLTKGSECLKHLRLFAYVDSHR